MKTETSNRKVCGVVCKKDRRTYTEKQKKLIKLLSENLGKSGFTKSMYEMMLEAGYSESTAKQQSTILVRIKIKSEMQDIVKEMVSLRNRAIEELKNRDFNKESMRDLLNLIKDFNHDIELMSGRSTERISNGLSEEEMTRLNKILVDNSVECQRPCCRRK